MTKKELTDWILSLTDDIEFTYAGKDGVICPISRNEISLGYDNVREKTYMSVDDMMDDDWMVGVPFKNLIADIEF